MGYRSQVRSLVYGPPDQLNALVVKHQLEGGKIFDGSWFADSLRRYRAVRQIYNPEKFAALPKDQVVVARSVWDDVEVEVLDLAGEGWKWYDNYEDVKAWHALLDEAEDFGCSYEFVRIGEEDGDIDRRCNTLDDGETWLGVTSSIYCDILEQPIPEKTDG